MIDDWDNPSTEGKITRTAQEAADFLRDRHGDNEQMRMGVLGRFVNRAMFESIPNELIFWACVFARLRRMPLNEASRREMTDLLNESRFWSH